MKKTITAISLGVLLLSMLIYVTGRWLAHTPMSDDTGDWFLWSGGLSMLIVLFTTISGVSLNIQRGLNAAAIAAILFLVPFGAWGLFTVQGQNQFPEMSGILPFFALVFAGVLLLLLAVFNGLWRRKKADAP
jgi:hypothetical protein